MGHDKIATLSLVAYDVIMACGDPRTDGWQHGDEKENWLVYFLHYDKVPADADEGDPKGIKLMVCYRGSYVDPLLLSLTPQQEVTVSLAWVEDEFPNSMAHSRHEWLGINLYPEHIQLAERHRHGTTNMVSEE